MNKNISPLRILKKFCYNFPTRLHFIPETIPKINPFWKQFWTFVSLIKSTEWTVIWFESQHKLSFRFYTKNYTRVHFFKHQNQYPLVCEVLAASKAVNTYVSYFFTVFSTKMKTRFSVHPQLANT